MTREEFMDLMHEMIDIYGGWYSFDENDTWFTCPECDELISFNDWHDDCELKSHCCPICGQHLLDEEEE